MTERNSATTQERPNRATDGWREVTLGEFAPFAYGKSLPVRRRNSSGCVPVIGSGGIVGYHDSAVTEGPTIVIGRKGTVGSVHYMRDPCWPIDTTFYVTGDDAALVRFKYYTLKTLGLDQMNSDSAVPGLNRNAAHAQEFLVPDEPEQRAIAHILGTLDDKIELNRRMNETLEEMARALFKSWFVDFNPVRAKQDGRWRRGESLPGLPADLWDAFPSRLVPSELGEIPEGWGVKPLGDCIDVTRGLSYKGSGLSSSGVPMHNLNSVNEGGGYKYTGIKYYKGDYRQKHLISPGDVIIANTEQGHDRLLIGYAAILPPHYGPKGLFSHHLYRVRTKDTSCLTPDFICHLLNTSAMQGVVSGYATGTTVNMLPMDALRIPTIVAPPMEIVATFSSIAEEARSKRENLINQSLYLAAMRDTLLPKLMSGELMLGTLYHFGLIPA